jgi:hypothetical protein
VPGVARLGEGRFVARGSGVGPNRGAFLFHPLAAAVAADPYARNARAPRAAGARDARCPDFHRSVAGGSWPEVSEGDRILEIVAGSATVDLPAPASGMLQETFVAEDDRISVGQELGAIMVASGRDE